jgi:hypothetical protein
MLIVRMSADESSESQGRSLPPGGFRLPSSPPLRGDEPLIGTHLQVRDFWRWALSDLATNVTRSRLAEFLVASALGDHRTVREEWADYDVLTQERIRVEVKAAAYLQTWRQWKPSVIRFGGLTGRAQVGDTGTYAGARDVRADVFVFAVEACTDVNTYNALDVAQWDFYIVDAAAVRAHACRSVSLAWVRQIAEPVKYGEVRKEVLAVGRR